MTPQRAFPTIDHHHDFVIAGGGMTGLGAAVLAAREGLRVALVQDRPVVGGNAGKEVRVNLSGANGGQNNAYHRETGPIEWLLLENRFRNPTGSAEGWDQVLRSALKAEALIELFLNTAVTGVQMDGPRRVKSLQAHTLAAETFHRFHAPLFLDATGDGTVGFLAGLPYRCGREPRAEFNESLAPPDPQPGTLGSSIFFQARRAGRPVPYLPPPWAHHFEKSDFRPGRDPVAAFRLNAAGPWWIEWGGLLDTIHDDPAIRDELLRVAYGIWDYLKNRSEIAAELAQAELDWVGAIAGKRESRRFEGLAMLTENDLRGQRDFPDAVAVGGWNLDDHPGGGFFADAPPCRHVNLPGMYNIPLRCFAAAAVENLFFGGRCASFSHVAFCSARVMITCCQMGEAIGVAAARAHAAGRTPLEVVLDPACWPAIQSRLLYHDHRLIDFGGAGLPEPADKAPLARVTASSFLESPALAETSGHTVPLDCDLLNLVALDAPRLDAVEVLLDCAAPTELEAALHRGDGKGNTFPEEVGRGSDPPGRLEEPAFGPARCRVALRPGARQWIALPFACPLPRAGWHFVELKANPALAWHLAAETLVGLKAYKGQPLNFEDSTNEYSRFQRLSGFLNHPQSFCVRVPGPQGCYRPEQVVARPVWPERAPNLWVSQPTDFRVPEWLELSWDEPQTIGEVHLIFNTSLDENLSQYLDCPQRAAECCVRDWRLRGRVARADWLDLASGAGNYQRRVVCRFEPRPLGGLRLELAATWGDRRASVFGIKVY